VHTRRQVGSDSVYSRRFIKHLQRLSRISPQRALVSIFKALVPSRTKRPAREVRGDFGGGPQLAGDDENIAKLRGPWVPLVIQRDPVDPWPMGAKWRCCGACALGMGASCSCALSGSSEFQQP
jgi:hypothetical protein